MTALLSINPASLDAQDMRRVINPAPKMSYWRRARARVMAGTGMARIGIIGSSSTLGTGAESGTGSSSGSAARRYASRCAAKMTQLGLPAQWNNIFGTGNVSDLQTRDGRLTLGSGWVKGVAPKIGGPVLQNATNKNPMTIAFTDAFDTFELGYTQSTSSPDSIEVLVDGVLVDTIATSGTTAFMKKQYLVTKGVHTVSVQKATLKRGIAPRPPSASARRVGAVRMLPNGTMPRQLPDLCPFCALKLSILSSSSLASTFSHQPPCQRSTRTSRRGRKCDDRCGVSAGGSKTRGRQRLPDRKTVCPSSWLRWLALHCLPRVARTGRADPHHRRTSRG